MSIYIFSRPVHSGKTTELLHWCNQKKNIRGIAMPDIDGSRKIMDLHTKEIFAIECTDAANTTEPIVSVGRFHFYSKAFSKANSVVINALATESDWLIIDEAGKLELNGKGFYDSIIKTVEDFTFTERKGNLLLTVRESLCDEVVAFFKIKNYRVIQRLAELT